MEYNTMSAHRGHRMQCTVTQTHTSRQWLGKHKILYIHNKYVEAAHEDTAINSAVRTHLPHTGNRYA